MPNRTCRKNALCDSVIVSGLLTYIRTYTHTEVILVYNRVNFVNSLLFLESWRGMSSERLPIFSFHRRKHNTNHCFSHSNTLLSRCGVYSFLAGHLCRGKTLIDFLMPMCGWNIVVFFGRGDRKIQNMDGCCIFLDSKLRIPEKQCQLFCALHRWHHSEPTFPFEIDTQTFRPASLGRKQENRSYKTDLYIHSPQAHRRMISNSLRHRLHLWDFHCI